jgi:hypothetical protein
MMPLELISMLGGGITGFVFRYLAEKRENDKQLVERLISLNENKDKLMNSAVKRVPLDVGKGVRQLIVLVKKKFILKKGVTHMNICGISI